MGIRGLVTYCKNNGCYEEYDLVSLAKNNKNLEILVDFYGIEQHILEVTLKKLARKYHNEYLIIPGAEYDELISAFREFHMMFTNIGIKLVYIADGPKGLDKINQQHKEKSWVFRFQKNMRVYENYLTYCKNPQNPLQIIREKIVRPCLMSDLFKNVIKIEGGEIINLIYGEADYQIANLRKERNSWAVLTNDSDFFVFHDCPTIQIGFFDMEKHFLQMRNFKECSENINLSVRPSKLIVGVISSKILMQRLKLLTHDNLIDFSVLMGNDYTVDFAESLRDFCGIKWKYDISDIAHSMRVAEWVRDQPNILINSPEFKEFSADKPDLKLTVQFSMDFYKQIPTNPVVKFKSEGNEQFWNYLVKRYKNGEVSSMCLSVFHGFCYQKNCIQPIVQGSNKDINSLLIPLRRKIYSLFLQQGLSTVIEYEVPNTPDFTRLISVPVSEINLKSFLETSSKYDAFNLFDKCWSEINFKETDNDNSSVVDSDKKLSLGYFNRFGTEIGFCCYCLRIFWCVTQRRKQHSFDLVVTEPEFRAIFSMVFFRLLRKIYNFSPKLKFLYSELVETYQNHWFYQLKICPSSVCETVQEWLQIIYFVAHTLYGKSLNIAQYFPEAFEFISGTVLAAFFEYVHNNGQRIRNLKSKTIHSIYEIMNKIFNEFSDIYNAIINPF